MNLKAKIWFQAQYRRVAAIFILLFSAKFMVVGYWRHDKPFMQAQHMPGQLGFVASLTDVRKMDRLIKHLEKIRADMVHKSKHHDGLSLRRNKGK